MPVGTDICEETSGLAEQTQSFDSDEYDVLQRALQRLVGEALERMGDASKLQRLVRHAKPTARAGESLAIAVLTDRELEVLECIGAGENNKDIARSLQLSLHTVKRHVANILRKLNVASRAQAAAWLHTRH